MLWSSIVFSVNDLASQSDSDVVINNVNISNMGEPGLYYFDETDGIAAFSSISSDIRSQIMCCDAIHINELTEDVVLMVVVAMRMIVRYIS